MDFSPFDYFTDPVLRAPTIGSMLMCLASSLMGVIVFLRKQSLLGEALSHSAYPGVVFGVIVAGLLDIEDSSFILPLLIMSGAFITIFLGYFAILFLERKMKVKSDSALCFVLSTFFGVGLLMASQVQFSYTSLYRQIQLYLYGQTATMTDTHIVIYAVLSFVILMVIFLFYKEIYLISFDREYAKSLGLKSRRIDALLFFLIVLSVVIGIRSVGVVLMSAMLIAPAVAARQYSNKLYMMFFYSSLVGVLSAYLGNYFSVELGQQLQISFPSGPMIIIIATIFCLLSILFARERGIIWRFIKLIRFRYQCLGENLLKLLWRLGVDRKVSFMEIAKYQTASNNHLRLILFNLSLHGWVTHTKDGYGLTADGIKRATWIVRLHRLWELYLADYLGVGIERVHMSAEEMEHVLTKDIEKELTILLDDPKYDPHHQPIPKEGL